MADARNELETSNAAMVYRDIPAGTRVRMTDGAVFHVTGNPNDGAWLLGYFEDKNNPSKVGSEEMVFFTDVASLA